MSKDVKLLFDVTAGTVQEARKQAVDIAAGFLGVAHEDVDIDRLKLRATPSETYRSGTGEPAQILGWKVHVRYRE